jgi:hypothetical protein
MKFTRRKAAKTVLGTAAGAMAALAQTPQSAATPDEELRNARQRLKTVTDTLAGQDVPMATEPAVVFRA